MKLIKQFYGIENLIKNVDYIKIFYSHKIIKIIDNEFGIYFEELHSSEYPINLYPILLDFDGIIIEDEATFHLFTNEFIEKYNEKYTKNLIYMTLIKLNKEYVKSILYSDIGKLILIYKSSIIK